ncbi:PQQ-dependent sugar dehydrogenase [Spirochaeta thermophila]|uniref:Glucose/Sorbosone dehydrogenase domain-containing protein n=1 Tax=Winmispira thermophila (strain ATCC 49972 / DSM 6192 / RI 19.B1) TaxID=665571 RepID=E0RSV3_WINT6|nr:PQQ-dependent sugar dehydrogenase [Spirochaeta thermophila]ADN02090.1 hypothetical protein STHERM_c11450 [Spirochaeta thermophila DSM 6192]
MTLRTLISVGLLILGGVVLSAEEGRVVRSEEETFLLVETPHTFSHPWGMAVLPDGSLLITEREGNLWLVQGGKKVRITGVPAVRATGQAGLLDVEVDPAFPEEPYLYLTFAAPGPGGTSGTALARARLSGTRLEDVRILWEMERKTSSGRHFGSRLAWAPDGTLFVSTGERGERNRAQDPSDTAGKILRFNKDGTIPRDNPFVGRTGFHPALYSLGHRNVQGLAVHPETGILWAHEHGPFGGDEVNIVLPGRNYGWPVITYGKEYGTQAPIGKGTHAPGMEQPVVYWSPSIAPSGMLFYTGEAFPRWKGNLFIGALAGTHLRRLVLEGDNVVHEEVLLKDTGGRVRDVAQDHAGRILLITDHPNGRLYVLEPPAR